MEGVALPLKKSLQTTSYLSIGELISSINFLQFIGLHLAAIGGAFFVNWSWKMVWFCLATYYLRLFGITAGYHRYFSHRSFQTSRAFQFVLAILGGLSLQKGALWWAAHHRHHHKYSDQDEDIHSPTLKGFLWSHCGWFLLSDDYVEVKWNYIPDLVKYPELVFLEKYHTTPGITFAAFLLVLGLEPFYFGFILATVLSWHGTFSINSLAHMFGTVRYRTTDTSKNNVWLSIITMGEGWHNNHHTYMSSSNQGFFWYEIDPTYEILRLLSWFGIVFELRHPPLEQLKRKLLENPEEQEKGRSCDVLSEDAILGS